MSRYALPGESMERTGRELGPRFTTQVNAPGWEFVGNTTEFLAVTRGCSHNGCRFCGFYKNVKYEKVPLEEVEFYSDYLVNRDMEIPVHRVFLQSSNAFHLSYDELMHIAEMLFKKLPNLRSIGSYSRISDLRDKSAEQLRNLSEAGYSNIFFGVESADDHLLELMRKGYDSKEMYEAGAKLDESGLVWSGVVMFGLGGRNYGDSHAIKTAEFFNASKPDIVGATSLTIMRDPFSGVMPPLMKAIERGEFVEAGEVERYQEMRVFIEHLDIETLFESRHSTMPSGFMAKLPESKDKLLKSIDKIINEGDEQRMRQFRETEVWAV